MKQFYLPIRNMLLGLMLCGCIDDPPPLSAPGGQTIAFSVSEAKNYFDSTATELRQVFFSDTPLDGTKAVSENRIVLAPRWDKARTSSNDQVTLVEIPIETSQLTRAAVRRHYDSGAVMGTRENVFYKLVVARRANGIMETFVVTLIPDYKYKSGGKDYVDDSHFLGGGDFTGMAFCSELNGRFVVAYAYANGRKTKALDVVLSAEVKVPEEEVYAKVQLANFSTLNSKVGAYPDGECMHGNWADNCEQCLDEVTVIATCLVCGHRGLECGCCQKCRVPYHQNCVHRPCVWCFSFPCQCATCVHCYSNPCRCTYCPKCHKRFCYGQCETMTTINGDVLMESAGWIRAFAVRYVMVHANAHGKYATNLLVNAVNFALVHATVHSATPDLASVPATIWKTMKPTRLKGRPFLQIISVGKAMCLA